MLGILWLRQKKEAVLFNGIWRENAIRHLLSDYDEVIAMPVTPATTSTEPGDYCHSNGSPSGKT